MSDQTQQLPPGSEFDQGNGWRVLDCDGNVVASGGVSIAQADASVGELIAQAQNREGEQD